MAFCPSGIWGLVQTVFLDSKMERLIHDLKTDSMQWKEVHDTRIQWKHLYTMEGRFVSHASYVMHGLSMAPHRPITQGTSGFQKSMYILNYFVNGR